MSPSEVETVYTALAEKLDAVDPAQRMLFLAKLALLLSHDLGDSTRALGRIDEAAQDLGV